MYAATFAFEILRAIACSLDIFASFFAIYVVDNIFAPNTLNTLAGNFIPLQLNVLKNIS